MIMLLQKAWLHVRNLVLRMLACAVQWGRSHGGQDHASNGVGGEEKCRQDVLSSLLEELRTHLESCQHLVQPHTVSPGMLLVWLCVHLTGPAVCVSPFFSPFCLCQVCLGAQHLHPARNAGALGKIK